MINRTWPIMPIVDHSEILHFTSFPINNKQDSLQHRSLVVPVFNTNSYGRRTFSVVAPLLWNSLPQHIRDAGSLGIFKRRLKTALFIRAF